MATTLAFLATFCCAIFAGAAIYINAVEHPARMTTGVRAALAEWAPSYRRATVMQASLAVLGFVFAISGWLMGAGPRVAVAGVLLVLVAPFAEAEALLARWNRLHLVRNMLATVALLLFLLP